MTDWISGFAQLQSIWGFAPRTSIEYRASPTPVDFSDRIVIQDRARPARVPLLMFRARYRRTKNVGIGRRSP